MVAAIDGVEIEGYAILTGVPILRPTLCVTRHTGVYVTLHKIKSYPEPGRRTGNVVGRILPFCQILPKTGNCLAVARGLGNVGGRMRQNSQAEGGIWAHEAKFSKGKSSIKPNCERLCPNQEFYRKIMPIYVIIAIRPNLEELILVFILIYSTIIAAFGSTKPKSIFFHA